MRYKKASVPLTDLSLFIGNVQSKDVHLPFSGWSWFLCRVFSYMSWVESWVRLSWMEEFKCVELSWWVELRWVDLVSWVALRWVELVSCVESETKKVGHMKAFASSKWAFRGPLILEKAKAFSKWILGVHNSLER